eukprot:NODE_3687_length_919_cov_20.262626_g3535_i0.p1 GENE.NODE_3687_length_919_cov_20.262626_g3535_i0~~NODE_3687_length_919_cov_20.262626_g3535_i0.p1  ORF type:complete len:276 (-),score=87.50 NODE_3687_length_919_cov_20.262626_g3535_i0:90-869(-)
MQPRPDFTQTAFYKDQKQLESYQTFTRYPHCEYLLKYTLQQLLGDVSQLTVLDLPSGIGEYSRLIAQQGVRRLICADLIGEQLEFSRKLDVNNNCEMEYHVFDAKKPRVLSPNPVHVAVVIHLTCFAENHAELREMCRSVFINLAPGGRAFFYGCNYWDSKHTASFETMTSCKVLSRTEPAEQGLCANLVYYIEADPPLTLHVNCWPLEVLRATLLEVGFTDLRSHDLQLDPNYSGPLNMEGFSDTTNYLFTEARKPVL